MTSGRGSDARYGAHITTCRLPYPSPTEPAATMPACTVARVVYRGFESDRAFQLR